MITPASFQKKPLIALTRDRKSTRLNSSHVENSYAVFGLKKKKKRFGMFRESQHERKICKTLPLGVFQQTVSSWTDFGIGLIAALFFFNGAATPGLYTLSLHDALPI